MLLQWNLRLVQFLLISTLGTMKTFFIAIKLSHLHTKSMLMMFLLFFNPKLIPMVAFHTLTFAKMLKIYFWERNLRKIFFLDVRTVINSENFISISVYRKQNFRTSVGIIFVQKDKNQILYDS